MVMPVCLRRQAPSAFGRVAAGAILFLALPLHLLLSVLIRACDGGPVFYKAPRVGRDGRVFTLYKYRSMRVASAPVITEDFKVITTPGDARVTPVGRIIRCGIDELPQFYNVLRGDMAWIGPRPDEPWMLPHWGSVIRSRVSIPPGITGLAQVLDSRYMPTAQAYALDVWYVRHRNFWLNVWILLATPFFMAGWRSVGRPRLQRLTASTGFAGIQQLCADELARNKVKTAADSCPDGGSPSSIQACQ